jgi:DNA-binding response OmpR family regulator
MKVLLVEDDTGCRLGVKLAIEISIPEAEVLEAATIRKGEEILRENNGNIDVIVVDGELPDGDGISFTRYVRANYAGKIIKIIGRPGDPRKEHSFMAAGADVFCAKPVADKLIEIIQALAPA